MFLFILPRGRPATSLRALIIPSSRLKERINITYECGCVRVRVSVNIKTKTKNQKERERERERGEAPRAYDRVL